MPTPAIAERHPINLALSSPKKKTPIRLIASGLASPIPTPNTARDTKIIVKLVEKAGIIELTVAVVDLTQEIGELFVKRVRAAQNFSNSSLIFLIQDYIFKHLNEPVNLTIMAEQLGYSKNYLCYSFKQATNQTIVNYANEQKIREIQSQLVFSNKTVTEIAAMLGFSDQSYLTKLFKKYLNTTPTRFRKKYHI